MNSRVLAALLVAGCVTAAAGGAYVAVRQNAAPSQPVATQPAPSAPLARPAETEAVAETEATVDHPSPPRDHPPLPPPVGYEPGEGTPPSNARPETKPAGVVGREATRSANTSIPKPAATRTPARRADEVPAPSRPSGSAGQKAEGAGAERTSAERIADSAPVAPPVVETPAEPARGPDMREPQRERQFDEIVLPASSVLGLKVETPLSSERTHPEDRVDARVTRDVSAGGRVAVPEGSRVIGSVTVVERGGKMKERARLGVRFHTLVLGDGREVPLRTEAIIREGDSPSNESARKIGGAAIGGAILGAIMGGGKGAVIGSAAGAAGGSAAVMAGDRNAATLPAGTVLSVRLAEPATLELERLPE